MLLNESPCLNYLFLEISLLDFGSLGGNLVEWLRILGLYFCIRWLYFIFTLALYVLLYYSDLWRWWEGKEAPGIEKTRLGSIARKCYWGKGYKYVKWNFCSKVIKGVARMKMHLVGTHKKAKPCEQVPNDVKTKLKII